MSFIPTKDQIIGAIEAKKWWREKNDPFFVVSGAPGTGKGTIAGILTKELEIPQVSTGDIFRKHIFSE